MLVHLAYTLGNVGWDNVEDNTAIMSCDKFMTKKLDYIISSCDRAYLDGFSHLRVPHIVPPVKPEILEDYLSKDNYIKKYRGCMINHPVSMSVHGLFHYHNFKNSQIDTLTAYYKKLKLIIEFLGVKNFYHTTHVNREDFNVIHYVYKELENRLGSSIKEWFCVENCHRGLALDECIDMSTFMNMCVVYDNFHNKLNGNVELNKHIHDIMESWKRVNKIPKIHYSNGSSSGEHGRDIDTHELLESLYIYSKHCKELIVMVELKSAKSVIELFKYRTMSILNWTSGMSFII